MNIAERTTPFTREEIEKFFEDNVLVEVSFIKVSNGELRSFVCTKNVDLIGQYDSMVPSESEKSSQISPPNQVRVFNVSDCNWRSFLVENLVEIQGVASA